MYEYVVQQILHVDYMNMTRKDLTPLVNCCCVQIMHKSHSRVPIYDGSRDNVVAVLLVKTIIELNPDDPTPLRQVALKRTTFLDSTGNETSRERYCRDVMYKPEDTPLYELLNEFQKGKCTKIVRKS